MTTAVISDARAELAGQSVARKNGDLRLRQIIQNNFGHVDLSGRRRMMFQKEDAVLRSDFLDFRLQRGCDLGRRFVGNNSDALGSGCSRRQTRMALRAPGANSASMVSVDSRSGISV